MEKWREKRGQCRMRKNIINLIIFAISIFLLFACTTTNTANTKKSAKKTVVAREVKAYSGAEIHTRQSQMYGKYEARMLMAAGSSVVSSMFLYYNNSYIGGKEPWCEVDIEILGKNPASFQTNMITGNAKNKATSEKHHAILPQANAVYHIYSIEWTPSYVAWLIDGVVVRKTERDFNDAKAQVSALSREQSLRFNLWSSESVSWSGDFDEKILPVHQFIDWVKVYSYTKGEGENGSDFTLLWQDEFDSFDENRWAKGRWTFEGNRAVMSPKNVNIVDGHLVLSLTKIGEEGFKGKIPF